MVDGHTFPLDHLYPSVQGTSAYTTWRRITSEAGNSSKIELRRWWIVRSPDALAIEPCKEHVQKQMKQTLKILVASSQVHREA